MWVVMLTIVVALATNFGSEPIKIPGLGDTTVFDSKVGVTILFLASLYCFGEFWPEHRVAKIRTMQAVATESSRDITPLFTDQNRRLADARDAVADVMQAALDLRASQAKINLAIEERAKPGKANVALAVSEFSDAFRESFLGKIHYPEEELRAAIDNAMMLSFPMFLEEGVPANLHHDLRTKAGPKLVRDAARLAAASLKPEYIDYLSPLIDDAVRDVQKMTLKSLEAEIDEPSRANHEVVVWLKSSGSQWIENCKNLDGRLREMMAQQDQLAKNFRALSKNLYWAHIIRFVVLDTYLPRASLVASGAVWVAVMFWPAEARHFSEWLGIDLTPVTPAPAPSPAPAPAP